MADEVGLASRKDPDTAAMDRRTGLARRGLRRIQEDFVIGSGHVEKAGNDMPKLPTIRTSVDNRPRATPFPCPYDPKDDEGQPLGLYL